MDEGKNFETVELVEDYNNNEEERDEDADNELFAKGSSSEDETKSHCETFWLVR